MGIELIEWPERISQPDEEIIRLTAEFKARGGKLFGCVTRPEHFASESAFFRDLPWLLQKYRHQWVAYCSGELLAVSNGYMDCLNVCMMRGYRPDDVLIRLIKEHENYLEKTMSAVVTPQVAPPTDVPSAHASPE